MQNDYQIFTPGYSRNVPDRTQSVLMVYLEPTPYIEGLIRELRRRTSYGIQVVYLGQNLSQKWEISTGEENTLVVAGGTLAGIQEIRARLNTGHYQLLHLAGWGTWTLASSIFLGRSKRIPVFVESDTHSARSNTFLRRALKRMLLPLLLKMPTGFLPGGNRQAQFLKQFGVSPARMTVAQMTVDVASIMEFEKSFALQDRNSWRHGHGLNEHELVLLYVGRLEPHKGLSSLMEAFRILVKGRAGLRLLIVGDGSMKDELLEAAKGLPELKFAGRLTDGELLGAYLVSDVFILPSLFEPWGLVVNEAMACGLPVIASNRVGAVGDLVVHEETGLVYDPDDPQGLTDCMATLADNPGLRRRYGDTGREKVSAWTLANEARNIMDAWERAL